jgi:hypothetical protein
MRLEGIRQHEAVTECPIKRTPQTAIASIEGAEGPVKRAEATAARPACGQCPPCPELHFAAAAGDALAPSAGEIPPFPR